MVLSGWLRLNYDERRYKPVNLCCCCLLGRENRIMGFHLERGYLFSLERFDRSLKEKDFALKTVKYYCMLVQPIFFF